ncbi:MAG: DUF1015 domain-containing protein [Pyrinomonadaceae bacterium]
MVFIKPFQALHPLSENAKAIACFPYDVAYETEAREFVRENPNSFLRVTRPEADFERKVDPISNAVLETAKRNLEELIESDFLVKDQKESIYVYRLETETHTQTGVVACCSLAEYESGVIKKHERTRPDKVADRTAHMVALRAQTGLILLAFQSTGEIQNAVAQTTSKNPIFEFTCASNIRHTVWRAENSEKLVAAFGGLSSLYIADGHHRIESARDARNILRAQNGSDIGNAQYDFVMAGMFPSDDLRILPYNRVVKDLNGLSDDEFFAKISEYFVLTEADATPPVDPGFFRMYFCGKWYQLKFSIDYFQAPDPIERLDVTILQKYLLEPILAILDPRTDERIGFVGGIRGNAELEKMVDTGEAVVAFSLYATTMDDLFVVSDMGEIMPPKSTWFEPKLKDGLFVHTI